MKWIKKGLIYGPDGTSTWAKHSALQPTPIILNTEVIRVYVGFRDDKGISRIGYVDVCAEDPNKVIEVSQKPVLDVGNPGTFDDNGVVPTTIISRDNKLFLYYAGYQLVEKVRFLAFCGLAISNDDGESFKRYSNVPVLDRTDDEYLFRVIHSIIFDNGLWKVWYGTGNSFIQGKYKTLPVYNIRYMESLDGINFPAKGRIAIDIKDDEHRVGRPYVIKNKGMFKMFFGAGTESEPYKLTYAESMNGIDWIRKDSEIGISLSQKDWDSNMMAYPAIITTKNNTYMFYNGNDYGKMGFGYAELEE